MAPRRQDCTHASSSSRPRGSAATTAATTAAIAAAAAAAAAATRRAIVVQLRQGVIRGRKQRVAARSLPVCRRPFAVAFAVALKVEVRHGLAAAALGMRAAVGTEQVAVVGPPVLPRAEEQVVEQAPLGHEVEARVTGGRRMVCVKKNKN